MCDERLTYLIKPASAPPEKGAKRNSSSFCILVTVALDKDGALNDR